MFDVVGKKWIFLGISAVLILISIVSLIFQGFNLNTDFSGGIAVTYAIDPDQNADQMTVTGIESIVTEALGKAPSSVQLSGDNEVVIKFGYDNDLQTDDEIANYSTEKVDAITTALLVAFDNNYQSVSDVENSTVIDETNTNADENMAAAEATEAPEATAAADAATEEAAPVSRVTISSKDEVSPSTGRELARSAVWMSVLVCALILVYVTIRFEFVSGLSAVIGLVHDVLILLGIYSVFRKPIDITFIAAVLTVLGYSINNSIVILDRIRENTRHARKQTYGEIANSSIKQTLTRSINTTVTTLITIVLLYIMGVTSIKTFALPIIIGIVIGTYSSIFVVGTVWSMWKDSGVKEKAKTASAGNKK